MQLVILLVVEILYDEVIMCYDDQKYTEPTGILTASEHITNRITFKRIKEILSHKSVKFINFYMGINKYGKFLFVINLRIRGSFILLYDPGHRKQHKDNLLYEWYIFSNNTDPKFSSKLGLKKVLLDTTKVQRKEIKQKNLVSSLKDFNT